MKVTVTFNVTVTFIFFCRAILLASQVSRVYNLFTKFGKALLILPILSIPGHTAPGADGVTG